MYFITCFQKYEIDKNGWPDLGAGRTFGYYNDRDVAIRMVELNNLDIHECLYDYAVIEYIRPFARHTYVECTLIRIAVPRPLTLRGLPTHYLFAEFCPDWR